MLDDCWESKHAELLNIVDAASGSACVITTRIRNLAPGEGRPSRFEVETSLLLPSR